MVSRTLIPRFALVTMLRFRRSAYHSFAIVLAAFSLAGGCKQRDSESPDRIFVDTKPRIVVTTGMVGDMVKAIVGDAAEVNVLMGPGVDPHLHQPTRGDAVDLKDADIVVYNGLHLEGQLGEVLKRRQSSGQLTIAVADGLDRSRLLDADAGYYDPHIWMDVALWADAIDPLTAAMAAAMPGQADTFVQSAAAYKAELLQLDRWASESLATIPQSRRVMITAHDAFRYFGRRYDVEVHGVQGVSTISEAGITDVNELVELIVTRDVRAVFFETSVSKRQVEAIVDGAESRGKPVSSDHTLYSDSLGAVGSGADTYVGMLRMNVRTITEALGGTVAPSELDATIAPSELQREAVASP